MFQLTMKTLSFMMLTATAVASTPGALRAGSDASTDDAMARLLSRLDTLEKQNDQLKQRLNALEEDSHQRRLNGSCIFKEDAMGTCVLDKPAAFASGLVVDGDDTNVFNIHIPTTMYSDVTIEGPPTEYPQVMTAPEGAVDATTGEPITSYTVAVDQPTTSFKMINHVNVGFNTDETFTVYNEVNFQNDVSIQIPTEEWGLKLEYLVEEPECDKKSCKTKSEKTHARRKLKHKSGMVEEMDANVIPQPGLFVGGLAKVNEKVEVLNGPVVLLDGDLEVKDGDASVAGELEVDSIVVKGGSVSIIDDGSLSVSGGAVIDGLLEAKGDVESGAFNVV